ncbi:hypothetical protein P152DRAFT_86783 [Eremomyces bilateralis CBS 781.70]|uniref:Uncharacterized protein n=1 Tax=Eremomyces bilateralis CBS 781.70 TaxID=1392243 RepID=A0A6G1FYM2_9PEZI|nr:uncharacterized protein P152DRAFT_86783 [Eremomyces bilateralis CBS 781.70]KAF1810874.1 hypothetical protein P152DRAFT_86783 [Eremomyces bilateralis CBS 781.70]
MPSLQRLPVVIAADRYDTFEAIKPMLHHWLSVPSFIIVLPNVDAPNWDFSNIDVEEVVELLDKLAAAYLFKDGDHFNKISRSLCHEHQGSIVNLVPKRISDVVPWGLLCLLQALRFQLQPQLLRLLKTVINSLRSGLTPCSACGWPKHA